MDATLPVVIIGAGPVGLAAAAHLVLRNTPVRLLEASQRIAPNLRDWGHVRLFSVWEQCIDDAARQLLDRHGWPGVARERLPTGAELVREYLEPLAAVPELASVIETGARVVKVARQGKSRVASKNRSHLPFAVMVENAAGDRRHIMARAIIDASGTWQNPNPLGADGWPAAGEVAHRDRIHYGIPDVSGKDRLHYAGQRTAVVGGGHSAANALIDLALLAESEPHTAITWIVRGNSLATIFGGGEADQLPARGALGQRLQALTAQQRLTLVTGFGVERVSEGVNGLMLEGLRQETLSALGPFDRIIAATGQRPDFAFARELQLDLHPVVESSSALGPLIDPNLHSCGSVPPHGWRELSHTEPDFFTVGVKSYGRAPTFLLLTGYEQVRSVAAHLAGDQAAADDVRLVLPETGVCTATLEQVAPGGLCCTGAAAGAAEPCCERPPEQRAAPCCAGQRPQPAADIRERAAACCG